MQVEDFYFSSAAGRARIVLGNRRWGENGYVASGRQQARPVQRTPNNKVRKHHAICLTGVLYSLENSRHLTKQARHVVRGQTTPESEPHQHTSERVSASSLMLTEKPTCACVQAFESWWVLSNICAAVI